MRRAWVSMISVMAGIMILGSVVGATKMSSNTECSSQPSKITLATMRLCDVRWGPRPVEDRWTGGGKIENLQGKKVIAILISEPEDSNSDPDPDPLKWDTSFIITSPELIQKVVSALERADRSRSGRERSPQYMSMLQFVFEDNTGVRINFSKHPYGFYYHGTNWISRDLRIVFEEMFGPEKAKKQPGPFPSPGGIPGR